MNASSLSRRIFKQAGLRARTPACRMSSPASVTLVLVALRALAPGSARDDVGGSRGRG
jgi:hypothetical protein